MYLAILHAIHFLLSFCSKWCRSLSVPGRHSFALAITVIGCFLCRNNLILRGSVELIDLVPHPLSEIVLQLEYVIQWSGPVAYKLEQKLVSFSPSNKFNTSFTLHYKGQWTYSPCACSFPSLLPVEPFPCLWAGECGSHSNQNSLWRQTVRCR